VKLLIVRPSAAVGHTDVAAAIGARYKCRYSPARQS
jgi:hypothetical protein